MLEYSTHFVIPLIVVVVVVVVQKQVSVNKVRAQRTATNAVRWQFSLLVVCVCVWLSLCSEARLGAAIYWCAKKVKLQQDINEMKFDSDTILSGFHQNI